MTPLSVRSRGVDLSPTAEQEELRQEVRTWLHANLPWEYGVGLPPRFDDLDSEVAFLREWQGTLAGGRWVGVAWPSEYGGGGVCAAVGTGAREEAGTDRRP